MSVAAVTLAKCAMPLRTAVVPTGLHGVAVVHVRVAVSGHQVPFGQPPSGEDVTLGASKLDVTAI